MQAAVGRFLKYLQVERNALKTPAGGGPDQVLYRVAPAEKATGLNLLPLNLECNRTSPTSWEITLLHYSRENDPAGSDKEELKKYDDYLLTLQIKSSQEDSLNWQTRLGIDDKGNLISPPYSLGQLDPNDIVSVVLVSWKKRTAN